jgi:hypothetical protein
MNLPDLEQRMESYCYEFAPNERIEPGAEPYSRAIGQLGTLSVTPRTETSAVIQAGSASMPTRPLEWSFTTGDEWGMRRAAEHAIAFLRRASRREE